jgi:hypothetical protein
MRMRSSDVSVPDIREETAREMWGSGRRMHMRAGIRPVRDRLAAGRQLAGMKNQARRRSGRRGGAAASAIGRGSGRDILALNMPVDDPGRVKTAAQD